jgi:hypothetical protein
MIVRPPTPTTTTCRFTFTTTAPPQTRGKRFKVFNDTLKRLSRLTLFRRDDGGKVPLRTFSTLRAVAEDRFGESAGGFEVDEQLE